MMQKSVLPKAFLTWIVAISLLVDLLCVGYVLYTGEKVQNILNFGIAVCTVFILIIDIFMFFDSLKKRKKTIYTVYWPDKNRTLWKSILMCLLGSFVSTAYIGLLYGAFAFSILLSFFLEYKISPNAVTPEGIMIMGRTFKWQNILSCTYDKLSSEFKVRMKTNEKDFSFKSNLSETSEILNFINSKT